jgi:hypothetical protein
MPDRARSDTVLVAGGMHEQRLHMAVLQQHECQRPPCGYGYSGYSGYSGCSGGRLPPLPHCARDPIAVSQDQPPAVQLRTSIHLGVQGSWSAPSYPAGPTGRRANDRFGATLTPLLTFWTHRSCGGIRSRTLTRDRFSPALQSPARAAHPPSARPCIRAIALSRREGSRQLSRRTPSPPRPSAVLSAS